MNFSTVLVIAFALLLFNFIVFAHELGHMLTAKLFGVRVNEFAIGMGPKIFKFQKGETLYSLRIFPIGGFCAMEGEDEESTDPRSFNNKKAWQKMIIVAIGAIINVIVGFLLFVILLCQEPAFPSTTVRQFTENSVSDKYGLSVGDKILAIDGFKIRTSKDISFAFALSGQKDSFNIDIERDGKNILLSDVHFDTVQHENGINSVKFDFYVQPIEKNFWTLMHQAYLDTISTVKLVWSSLVGIISGKVSMRNLSGPIGMASEIGNVTQEALKINVIHAINSIISIMAMITVNLGVVNLLPLPALDGGRLIFLFVELITGKPINPKYEGLIHTIGFLLFIALTLFITYSDIIRLFKG